MVSPDVSPDTFIPLDFTADQLPAEQVDIMGQTGPAPNITPGGAGQVAQEALGLTSLFGVLGALAGDVVQALGDVDFSQIGGLFSKVGGYASEILQAVDKDQVLASSTWSKYLPTSGIIKELMLVGLDVNPDDFDADGQKAITVIDSLGSVVIGLLFVSSAVDLLTKIPLASRAPKGIREAIKELPNEIGLGWFMGNTLEAVFEAAIGNALERNIKRQMRLDEPEWQVIRLMLRQHVSPPYGLEDALKNAGYNDDWVKAITQLEVSPMPVGDIQALYQQGLINDDVRISGDTVVGPNPNADYAIGADNIDYWLVKLGFSDEARALLKQLYITKAETSAGAEIRSVFRSLYRESLVSKQDYIDALTRANYPERLIKDDLYAIDTEKSTGWRSQSVSVIKSDYLHHPGSQQIAVNKLVLLGYSQTDAADMVASWSAPPIKREHGLTQSQILKYMVAGLLDPGDARPKLMALGLDDQTVSFLLAHPTIPPGSRPIRLTPGTVTTAYVQGIITQDQYYAKLQELGLTGDQLDYVYRNGLYKYAHHHNPGSGTTTLDKGEIREAFKVGLIDEQSAMGMLENLGYSADNALILLEITNKGPIVPPQPPAFPDVASAAAYLGQFGIDFQGQTSPQFEAALNMVEQAGYVPIFPPGFTAPTSPVPFPVGGQGGAGQQPPTLPPPA